MQQMAQSAYTGKTLKQVGTFELFYATPTLKFYRDGNVIIVSIRGTQDQRDFASWPDIALGTLDKSARFQADLKTLNEVRQVYPPSEFQYAGVGHSLGAAIMDRFISAGLITTGLSYNGAVEPQFVRQNPKHRRIYNAADPLYNIVGRFIPGVEVRPVSVVTGLRSLLSPLYASYKSHMISTFRGGMTHREAVLGSLGLESSNVAELSKLTGVPRAVLQEVYNRGIGAYKTNPASVRKKGSFEKGPAPMSQKLSKEQWAMARVYSFLDGNPKHDQDLRLIVRNSHQKDSQ